jgi:hypothetical protein
LHPGRLELAREAGDATFTPTRGTTPSMLAQ